MGGGGDRQAQGHHCPAAPTASQSKGLVRALQWAGRSQHLGCLPVSLVGGWACGYPLPRAGMSRSGTRSLGQCHLLSGQGGPSCLGSEGLGFTPTPMVLGLGVLLTPSHTPTFPVAHPSSFGGAGLAQLEPTWLARSGLASPSFLAASAEGLSDMMGHCARETDSISASCWKTSL